MCIALTWAPTLCRYAGARVCTCLKEINDLVEIFFTPEIMLISSSTLVFV